MLKIRILPLLSLSGLLLAATLTHSQAQTTANWIGPSSGGEWNTASDWDTGLPPGLDANATTNAVIGQGTNVLYNLPMTAASFGALTLNGVLNVNTNGFNCGSISMVTTAGGERLFMTNSGSVVNLSGALTMSTNTYAVLGAGASLTVGSLIIDAGTTTKANGTSTFTNNGGFLTANSTTVNNTAGTGTGLLMINAGTNILGTTAVSRCNAGAGGLGLGLEGLVINGGLVIMTNLNLGEAGIGASSLSCYITGGVVTNNGSLFINQGSSGRFSRLLQTGGLFVVPDPGVVNPNPTVSGSINNYTVNGGTNVVGGFYFGNTNGNAGTVNFTNNAVIYVGSQGINWNGAVTLTAMLDNGGLFGATAPWTGLTALKLNSGTFTFQTADLIGNANNITLSGIVSGNGGLNVTGGGTLTLGAAETYSGNTAILGGTLAIASGGSLVSPRITVGSGTTFDVSQSGGFILNANQTLAGFGTVAGAVTAGTASIIYPGSNSVTGTLTLPGGLTENGGVNNQFNLSSNPTGPNNDFVNATGGLTLTGTNTVTIIGSLPSGGAYPLFGYSSLTGDITNLAVTGATGTFLNNTTAKIIYFVAQTSIRTATNVTWLGNAVANNWDVENATNWLNKGTGLLDYFVPGDMTLFSNLGASNAVVNIPGSVTVTPGTITINTSSNYTFTGNGAIGGTGSLTVSNGTVTILTTNVYTGATILDGGVLATPNIANSGTPSGIGEATSDPGNWIFNGGTFYYTGASAGTDHGITFTNGGGVFDITNGTELTLNGTLGGPGGFTLIDTGVLQLTAGNNYTGSTTISNGTLILDNAAALGAGSLVLAGGTLDLIVGSEPTYPNNVVATGNSTIISAGGNNNIFGGTWTGASNTVVNITNNSTSTGSYFTFNGAMTNFYGTIEMGYSGGNIRFNANGGNTQFGATNATIDLGSNTAALLARNPGTMAIGALAGGVNTIVKGPSSTPGTLVWAIGSNPNVPNSVFDGKIEDFSGNEFSSVDKIGTGTLTLSGQNSYTGNTIISSGELALIYNPTNGNDGSIDASASINLVSGAVLDVSGRSDTTFQVGSSTTQLLYGRGTINGNLTVGGTGTVAPGGGPGGSTGILTVTNAVSLSGTVWMKLNRAVSPTSDRLVSSHSTITYGGTLVITNIGSGAKVGDTFTLFSGSGLSAGSFSTVVQPSYYSFDLSQLGVNGTITLTNAFRPAISSLNLSTLASNGTIVITATNGLASGSVNVLTTTNLALPLSGWVTNTSTTFDGNGNLNNFSISVDNTQPQLYILLQTQ